MKNYIKYFLGATLAGILIGISAVLTLSVTDKVIGAFLFSVGIYAIAVNKLNLFTGRVGYVVNEKYKGEYIKYLCITLFGNLFGVFLAAFFGVWKKIFVIEGTISPIITGKSMMLVTNPENLFFLAVFCGLLMYIAEDGYKKTENPAIIILPTMAFILAGFEHSIADMFYVFAAVLTRKQITFATAIGILFLVTLGNIVGAILIPLYNNFKTEEKKKAKFDLKNIFKGKKKVSKKK